MDSFEEVRDGVGGVWRAQRGGFKAEKGEQGMRAERHVCAEFLGDSTQFVDSLSGYLKGMSVRGL